MLKSGNRGIGYSQEVASTVSLSFNIFEKFYYFICVFIFPMNQVYKPPDCPMIELAYICAFEQYGISAIQML